MAKKKKFFSKHPLSTPATKSIPILPAQSTTLSQLPAPLFAEKIKIASEFVANEKNYIIDRIVIQLLLANGIRISEVLNIKSSDIAHDGSILIHSKKGSDVRYISGSIFSKWLADNPVYFASNLKFNNRFYYYRLFKRIGLQQVMSGNTNASVTHLFRYAFIANLQKMTKNIEDTGTIVGHKNKANTKRYNSKSNKNG